MIRKNLPNILVLAAMVYSFLLKKKTLVSLIVHFLHFQLRRLTPYWSSIYPRIALKVHWWIADKVIWEIFSKKIWIIHFDRHQKLSSQYEYQKDLLCHIDGTCLVSSRYRKYFVKNSFFHFLLIRKLITRW